MATEQNVTSRLIRPCGGELINLHVDNDEELEARERARHLPSIKLSERAVCDLELLAIGAFSPLDRFVGKADFQRILDEMRLCDGQIFPIPITLPVEANQFIQEGKEIALCNARSEILALMKIEEIFDWEIAEIAGKVLDTQDSRHPLVAEMHRWGKINISGPLKVLNLPRYIDFINLRLSPGQVRSKLEAFGRPNVVAFQTRNPLHRVHEEMTK